MSRSLACRGPRRPKQHARLRERLRALASDNRRYGFRRLHERLKRKGWRANHKLAARLYQEERLTIRRRARQKRGAGTMPGHWCPPPGDSAPPASAGRWTLPHPMQQAAWGSRPGGHLGQWPQVPHGQSERRLHPRMPRDPRRLLAARAPHHPDAQRRRSRARQSGYPRRRQSTVGRRSIRSAQPVLRGGREGARSPPAATSRAGRTSTASGCFSSIPAEGLTEANKKGGKNPSSYGESPAAAFRRANRWQALP